MPPATITDVARAAGVSPSTVSRALNGGRASAATIDQVTRAAARLKYRPSYIGRVLSAGRTDSVAAVVASLRRSALIEALGGLHAEAARQGVSVTIVEASGGQGREDAALLRRDRDRFDGIVLLGRAGEEGELDADGHGGPLGSYGDEEASGVLDPVACAVEHLHRLGHRRVHYIGVDPAAPERTDYDAVREAAFFRACSDSVVVATAGGAAPTVDGGFSATVTAVTGSAPRPTALIAGTAEIAIGAATALRQLGLHLPADISLIGIEDHPLAALIGVTTVDVGSHERGRRLAWEVVKSLHPDASGVILEPSVTGPHVRLRLRSSC